MPITKGFQALVDEAMEEIKTYSVEAVKARLADPAVQIVDIRDPRELNAGTVVGAFHAPRGMLEFWVDPASPYFKPIFADESKEFILFCGAGHQDAAGHGHAQRRAHRRRLCRMAKAGRADGNAGSAQGEEGLNLPSPAVRKQRQERSPCMQLPDCQFLRKIGLSFNTGMRKQLLISE